MLIGSRNKGVVIEIQTSIEQRERNQGVNAQVGNISYRTDRLTLSMVPLAFAPHAQNNSVHCLLLEPPS